MQLHIRMGGGHLVSKVYGKTAIELQNILSTNIHVTSAIKPYSGYEKENVLTYKITKPLNVPLGDIEFNFWANDYVYFIPN